MLRLDLVVGPNGAGKSTFVRLTLAPSLPPGVAFVNADDIARQRWPADTQAHSYEAARIADQTRSALILARQPMIAETVFSHPSKLDLISEAQAADYHVFLHVLMVPVELSVARVVQRVSNGGHPVPEDKVRARYERLWSFVATAVSRANVATVYDNSSVAGPEMVAQWMTMTPVGAVHWPVWTPRALTEL